MQKRSCKKAEINVPKLVVGTGKDAKLIATGGSTVRGLMLHTLCNIIYVLTDFQTLQSHLLKDAVSFGRKICQKSLRKNVWNSMQSKKK